MQIHRISNHRSFWGSLLGGLILLCGCQPETKVGSDCDSDQFDCKPTTSALKTIKEVDILFVMDTSHSMSDEQDAVGDLIRVLITGDRDGDGDPDPDLDPAESVHLGVITTDMGLPSLASDQNPAPHRCIGLGQDGVLQHHPDPEIDPESTCDRSYPSFVTHTAEVDDPEQSAQDFSCMLKLGIQGCGFEMPLEAALKALWPSGDDSIEFLNERGELVPGGGHGDAENKGFLRQDSLLAIVVVTDEDDCSTDKIEIFGLDYTGERKDVNLRCFQSADELYPIQRYLDGFRALRPGSEDRVIFAAISGIPSELVDPESDLPKHLLGYVDKDVSELEAYYTRILDDPRMQQVEDQKGLNLESSCQYDSEPSPTTAFPPVRLTQLAKSFGANGVVQSICHDDLSLPLRSVTLAITNRMIEAAKRKK